MTDPGRPMAPGAPEATLDQSAYLEAVLRTIRQPLVVLDGALRVETANRAFYDAFAVAPRHTEGRLIYDLGNGQWNIPALRDLLEDVVSRDTEVEDYRVEHDFERIGRRVMLLDARRIAADGAADRILLAIEDVTERELDRWRLMAQRDYAEKIVDAARDPLLILDMDLRVQTANATFYRTFQTDPAETEGCRIYELGNGQWDIPRLRELLENVLPDNEAFDDFVVENGFADLGWRTMVLNARRVDHVQLILLSIEDRTEAHRAAAARAASEARFRAFVSASSDVMYRLSPDWTEMRCLDGCGVPTDTADPDDTWFDRYIHPGDKPAMSAAIAEARERRATFALEHRVLRADGTVGWVTSRAVPIFDARGAVTEWFGAARDVTERRATEAALRDSEARLAAIFEGASVGLAEIDPQGRFLGANEEFCRILGRPRDEVLSLAMADVTHPDDLEHSHAVVAGILDGRQQTGVSPDRRYVRPDGSLIWAHSRATRLPAHGKAHGNLLVVTHDLSERKAAEEAVRESEARFRQFGEASSDALWVRDARTLEWEYLSPAFDRIYGIDRESALASRSIGFLLDLILEEDREQTLEAIRSLRSGARAYEYRIRRISDGAVRWLRTTGFRLRDSDGAVRRLGGITHDMTEERQSADRMEVLVAELQHRTRNLIGVIRAMATRTLHTSGSLEEFRIRFSDRLDALARVNGLLSRLEKGARISFNELLQTELAGHGAADTDAPGAQVTLDGPAGVRLPSASVQTLALAIHELLTNATKYGALSRPEGRLSIRWRRVENGRPRLRVEWRESGIDLSAADARPVGGGGYGRELIERALPYQLGAETTYELKPDGLSCVVCLPVATPSGPKRENA